MVFFFFFFKQKTAYEISACLVGSEMCIRDSYLTATYNCNPNYARFYSNKLNISNAKIEEILQNIKGDERAMFSEKLAREILERQNF